MSGDEDDGKRECHEIKENVGIQGKKDQRC